MLSHIIIFILTSASLTYGFSFECFITPDEVDITNDADKLQDAVVKNCEEILNNNEKFTPMEEQTVRCFWMNGKYEDHDAILLGCTYQGGCDLMVEQGRKYGERERVNLEFTCEECLLSTCNNPKTDEKIKKAVAIGSDPERQTRGPYIAPNGPEDAPDGPNDPSGPNRPNKPNGPNNHNDHNGANDPDSPAAETTSTEHTEEPVKHHPSSSASSGANHILTKIVVLIILKVLQ